MNAKLGGARASWSSKGNIICHLKIRWSISDELDYQMIQHGGDKGLWRLKLDELKQLLKQTPYIKG